MTLTASFVVRGQNISAYSFAQTTGTYKQAGLGASETSLYGGTVWDDMNFATITLPFTFTYHGTAFTTITPGANGYAQLGTLTAGGYNAIGSYINVLSPFNRDLDGNSTNGGDVSYNTVGATPNRVFTIQWKNWGFYSSCNAEMNFQIKLYETSNKVQFIYAPGTPISSITDLHVGLNGATTTDCQTRICTAAGWAGNTAGVLASVSSFSSSIYPTSGLTFTWTSAATVAAMTFTQTTGVYVPIEVGTAMTSWTPGTVYDDDQFATFTLPFTFLYAGTGFTTIGAGANGYAQFGSIGTPLGYSAISYNSNVLSPLNADLEGNTANNGDCSVITEGTSPNQVVVIQWSNWGFYSSALNEVSFQIRLYQTTNVVQFVYGPAPGTTSRGTTTVGLDGATTTDEQGRYSTTSWNATTLATTGAGSNVQL